MPGAAEQRQVTVMFRDLAGIEPRYLRGSIPRTCGRWSTPLPLPCRGDRTCPGFIGEYMGDGVPA
jgi:hypothetical protein